MPETEPLQREVDRLRRVCESWGSNYQSWVDGAHAAEVEAQRLRVGIEAERTRHGGSMDPDECFACPDEDYPCAAERRLAALLETDWKPKLLPKGDDIDA